MERKFIKLFLNEIGLIVVLTALPWLRRLHGRWCCTSSVSVHCC